MADSFVGRRAELALMEKAYRSPGSAFIPVYGRRRVGKSELIFRFLQGKTAVYHLGKKAPAQFQIREFLEGAAAALREPLLASLSVPGWREALEAVASRGKGPRKLVLAFDEFQWTAAASPELPSILQAAWDLKWRRSGEVLLILCGSFVGFMEREVLGKKSPLFGRRTAQILLRPFDCREAAEFHPSYSLESRAATYFICGGVPLYLQAFSADLSVEDNIKENILDEHKPLFKEPDFLLREELREVENYHAVLLAVAAGRTAQKDIARYGGIGERALSYYLQQLIELGYLARRHPLDGNPPSPRRVRYALEDPFLRFWFRFVFPNLSYLAQMGGEKALRQRIRPDLQSYFGLCFERLCREALPGLYEREKVSAAFNVGEYWDRTVQIDVVGLRDDGWTDLGECRWGTAGGATGLVEELREKAGRFPNHRGATIGLRIFTRHPIRPPTGSLPGLRWHSLQDLYRR